MTLAELQKLTNEEIDREIAVKVMGWSRHHGEWDGAGRKTCELCGLDISRSHTPIWCQNKHGWNPSTDHNDIAAVRVEAERREVKKLFVLRLTEIVYKNVSPSGDCYWSLINATPRQQCEAILLAMEDER